MTQYPVAVVYVDIAGQSAAELFASLAASTNASVTERVGALAAVSFEVHRNPDADARSNDWIHFPLTVDVYSLADSADEDRCQALADIEALLDVLRGLSAAFVTASDWEHDLAQNGRNYELNP